MQFFRFFLVRFVRFFSGSIATERYAFLVEPYLRLKGFFLNPWMVTNTFKSMLICAFLVGLVLSVGSFAQVINPIIGLVLVLVIYLMSWPLCVHVEPSKPMRRILFPINFDVYVPLVVQGPSYFSDPDFWPRHGPSENSSFWVIGKKFTKQLVSNV